MLTASPPFSLKGSRFDHGGAGYTAAFCTGTIIIIIARGAEENLTLMDTCFSLAEPPQTEDCMQTLLLMNLAAALRCAAASQVAPMLAMNGLKKFIVSRTR